MTTKVEGTRSNGTLYRPRRSDWGMRVGGEVRYEVGLRGSLDTESSRIVVFRVVEGDVYVRVRV